MMTFLHLETQPGSRHTQTHNQVLIYLSYSGFIITEGFVVIGYQEILNHRPKTQQAQIITLYKLNCSALPKRLHIWQESLVWLDQNHLYTT